MELKGEMTKKDGWIEGKVKCVNMKQARKGNELEKIMGKIVDGTMDSRHMHSTMSGNGGIGSFITSGTTYDKYRFGKWGLTGKNYETVNLRREGKRTSGRLEFFREWNDVRVIECEWEEVIKGNEYVKGIDMVVRHVRKHTLEETLGMGSQIR